MRLLEISGITHRIGDKELLWNYMRVSIWGLSDRTVQEKVR